MADTASTFFADQALCTQCGLCAEMCPAGVIRFTKGAFPEMRAGGECIRCGHCMVYCPVKAARVNDLPESEMLPADASRLPDPETIGLFCRSRRSVRRFKKEPVPKQTLLDILDVARYAPSAKNRQATRWILVYQREKIEAIGDCMARYYFDLPEGKLLARAWKMGVDPIFRGAPHLALAVAPADWPWSRIDAAISLTYLELAALSYNVGACWAGYVTSAVNAYAPLRSLLGIAEEEILCGGQMLGFIGLRAGRIPPREPLRLTWLE